MCDVGTYLFRLIKLCLGLFSLFALARRRRDDE